MASTANLQHLNCPICAGAMPAAATPWNFYCRHCDYWGSGLQPVTDALAKDAFLTAAERSDVLNPIGYLDELRITNFRSILRHIMAWKPTKDGLVLEVGCGPGLFLTEAAALGLNTIGIEPFETMARRGQSSNCNIRLGLFPNCLDDREQFDAIVFNDVFEHLPDAPEVLRTCLRHLVPGGLVVLNLPGSQGLFFRVARLAASLGYLAPWNRMWQRMFYSPHLHYWSPKSLDALCHSVGLEPVTKPIDMVSVSCRGLWKRIRAAPDTSLPTAVVNFVAALGCAAIAPLFPSDCFLQVFRKPL